MILRPDPYLQKCFTDPFSIIALKLCVFCVWERLCVLLFLAWMGYSLWSRFIFSNNNLIMDTFHLRTLSWMWESSQNRHTLSYLDPVISEAKKKDKYSLRKKKKKLNRISQVYLISLAIRFIFIYTSLPLKYSLSVCEFNFEIYKMTSSSLGFWLVNTAL